MKERILLTGSEGTVGKVLQRGLKDNFEVLRLDKQPTYGVHDVDMAHYQNLEQLLKSLLPFPYVIHLAASADHRSSPDDIIKNNVVATTNLYEFLRTLPSVKKVIFASTTHIQAYPGYYPERSPYARPIKIDDPPHCDSPYGASKLFGEQMAQFYHDVYKIPIICLRIGGVSIDNNPIPPYDKLWLSHRDAIQVFLSALKTEETFGIYYAMSGNKECPYDIHTTMEVLGYAPADGA